MILDHKTPVVHHKIDVEEYYPGRENHINLEKSTIQPSLSLFV